MKEKLKEICGRLTEAGFDAREFGAWSFGCGMSKVFSCGISVRVKAGDERFQWDTSVSRSSLGPVADGGSVAQVSYARGFEFCDAGDGFYLLSSTLKDDGIAEFFCDLFLSPRGAGGKIVGPKAVPAGLQLAMAA